MRFPSIFFGLLLYCGSAHADQIVPNDRDLELIRQDVSKQMLDPSSTLLSNVVGADQVMDGSVSMMVCGNVQGRNTFGGYAQPTPFMGMMIDNENAGRQFITISIAGPSEAERYAVLSTCLEALKKAELTSTPSEKIKASLEQWATLNSRCRGTEGGQPGATVCEERTKVDSELKSQGWCYGREGEAGYQSYWHICGATSLR